MSSHWMERWSIIPTVFRDGSIHEVRTGCLHPVTSTRPNTATSGGPPRRARSGPRLPRPSQDVSEELSVRLVPQSPAAPRILAVAEPLGAGPDRADPTLGQIPDVEVADQGGSTRACRDHLLGRHLGHEG